ncbi:hypothetical protein BpHYR1_041196 [Brachionus plicatilis]|uniref:Uncharacterized protein n=1 Tax=Brachionus plicatilis TaxID=10195 RepID=A0A3M7T9C1_BRAPC|nr:hypothetical protein BpHYR1_041196 [Brachionus plicatilis]
MYSSTSALAIPTCVPRARNRPNPKWFNVNIKQLTKKKYILHFRIRSAPRNSELKALYVTVCKQAKTAVRNAIYKYEDSISEAVQRHDQMSQ